MGASEPGRSLAGVFRTLNDMRERGLVVDYAIGGATAVLFYAEPTRTYDLDVFVLLPPDAAAEPLASLSGIYAWARARGFGQEREHLMIAGVPVQFLPAYNALVEEAVTTARVHDYEGVDVRVVAPEPLAALALQAGGPRRRERAWQLVESGVVDRDALRALLTRHGIAVEIPDHA